MLWVWQGTATTPALLKFVAQHKLAVEKFGTHHFALDDIIEAYDPFGRAAETRRSRWP